MSDDDTDFGNFLIGFVVGGLIGAAAALLFAPQSGEETRTLIKEKSIELKDKAIETAEDARVRAEEGLEIAQAKAKVALEEVQLRAADLARMTKERAGEMEQRLTPPPPAPTEPPADTKAETLKK
jgi:gas vesicle protein